MLAKNNTDSEYYGRDFVTWCNVSNICNMSGKNNSDSEYYGRDFVTQNKKEYHFCKNNFSNMPK